MEGLKHHIQESQEVSTFAVGDHKTAMNRKKASQNINNKSFPQKKHRLGTLSNNFFTGGLKLVLWYQPPPKFRCGSRQIDVWFA